MAALQCKVEQVDVLLRDLKHERVFTRLSSQLEESYLVKDCLPI